MANGCDHPAACHTGEAPVLASATVGARHWLLIEHPGPWAASLDRCRLPGAMRTLLDRAAALGIRGQLIRRPGSRKAAPGPIHVFVASSRSEEPWVAEGFFENPNDLDLDALGHGVVPESCILVDKPVFLVCTHGKRNACCARLGLPLARHLAASLPGEVWETTHVGGDRYAANLVCLPHGLYYGSMSQAAAIAAAHAYRRGEVVLDRFRGRAGIPEPLQAAEHFTRVHTGELSVDGVAVESSWAEGDATVCVVRCTSQRGLSRFRVVVEPTVFSAPCGETCAEAISTYRLAGLSPLMPVST
ncbi:MAG: sucrase ferredoxin [Thermobispora bispora]|uniref:Sucraseferredoxin family protein n=2 Tax=Thermobispora bispora TaxID=2006 RepID=D6Y375_THEBD|nr:Sucraseferredoxin family protein [Thermobispora bispora DSM 43833]MBO2474695.1 sucrase ferredoxin [Actinomycetales bacterium]MBX6168904.1 sucrase ferredoxin [Thermobispora bispora]QSI48689.1 sucrase ferredoxin [Thermobispora bispora]